MTMIPPDETPHNRQAEAAVVGSILLDPAAPIAIAGWLKPEHFADSALGTIYAAALACFERRTPPDLVTIAAELKAQNKLEDVGGVPFLIKCSNNVPTAFYVEHYAQIVEEQAVRRRLLHAASQITRAAVTQADDLDTTIKTAERLLSEATERRGRDAAQPLAQLVDDYYAYLMRVQDGGAPVVGLPTGLVDVDRHTGGLQKSDLIILAARPGVGKSSFAMSIAYDMARRFGTRVGVFSLEMGKEQLLQRMLAMHTGIDTQKLRTGRLTPADLAALMEAMGEASGLPIHIDDTPGLSSSEFRHKARRLYEAHNIDLLIVDYLQLMDGSGKRSSENRVQEVTEITRTLKRVARELDIPIIALSQLSRAVEGRTSHVPVLADLRESGSIEQDADMVIFIYREEMYDKDTDKTGVAELHFAKFRNGPLGVVSLHFDARTTRFRDYAPSSAVGGY